MDAYEKYACGYYLSEYQRNYTFDEVLDAVRKGDDTVLVWKPFEDMSGDDVATGIIDMVGDLRGAVPDYYRTAIELAYSCGTMGLRPTDFSEMADDINEVARRLDVILSRRRAKCDECLPVIDAIAARLRRNVYISDDELESLAASV